MSRDRGLDDRRWRGKHLIRGAGVNDSLHDAGCGEGGLGSPRDPAVTVFTGFAAILNRHSSIGVTNARGPAPFATRTSPSGRSRGSNGTRRACDLTGLTTGRRVLPLRPVLHLTMRRSAGG